MLRINIFLVFCIIGLCAAATTKPKTRATTVKPKDVKEKRDAAIAAGPYNYETPQKTFYINAQQQQKAAPIEYHQAPQKVAPLEQYQQKQQAPVQFQEAVQQYQQQPQEPAQHYYPTGLEGIFGHQQSVKGLGEFNFNYPGLESFGQMPVVHYSPELNKLNTNYVTIPGYKSPSFSSYKSSPYQQQQYSFGSPSPAYSFPVQSFAIPQQQHQLDSFLSNFAHSAPSAQSEQSYYGFSQSPSALFVPQTVSISPKPTKIPDYAQNLKGLGHFSSVQGLGPQEHNPTPASVFYKQAYEAPQYLQYTQTERPFKPSAYLGSQQVDSHSEQSISNAKPAGEYLPPSKNYLPAKEQQIYTSAKGQQAYAPVKEQQQYVPAKAQQNYAPAKAQQNYAPVKEQQDYAPAKAQQNYAPAKAQQNYAPAREQEQYSFVKEEHHYVPAKEQQQYAFVKEQHHYVPANEEEQQYSFVKEQHYAPEQAPVEYQIQYVQAPSKSYIPPVSNNYLPPKSTVQPPKTTYLPSSTPKYTYISSSTPKNVYLPANQPTSEYLPPNNPYVDSQQANYHSSGSHSVPSQQYQQYHHQDSYESLEYESVTPSGHK